MKIYALPKEVPAPEFDYKNFDFKNEEKKEKEHTARLEQFLRSRGYDGKLTGKIFRTGMGDGCAQYMFADSSNKRCLFHLPYGDAWHDGDVQYLPEQVVIQRLVDQD